MGHDLFAVAGAPFWNQTFASHDLLVVLLLVFFEGVLSIDNAIVLGLLAKRLPRSQQQRALTYGLIGAFAFRFIAILAAAYLLEWRIVKLIGGGYLLYIAIKHLFFEGQEKTEETITANQDGGLVLRDALTGQELNEEQEQLELDERLPIPSQHLGIGKHFWTTVMVIELTDIAFAIDSILAAIALIGSPPEGHPDGALHPKLWVVMLGGLFGILLMRGAAALFIRLLDRFPRMEVAAYLLVITIGLKLLVDWGFNTAADPHVIDFHDHAKVEFWLFWIAMIASLSFGVSRSRRATEIDQQ